MTLFTHYGHTCPVTECPRNKGERGLSCGFASDPVLVCLHPVYKVRWRELTAPEQEQCVSAPAPEPEPVQQMGLRL